MVGEGGEGSLCWGVGRRQGKKYRRRLWQERALRCPRLKGREGGGMKKLGSFRRGKILIRRSPPPLVLNFFFLFFFFSRAAGLGLVRHPVLSLAGRAGLPQGGPANHT